MTSQKNFRINSFVSGLAIKAPCVTETVANIVLSGLQTINGVVLLDGDRVLVKDQTLGYENGLYNASATAWDRTGDWDGNRDVTNGTLVVVARSTNVAVWQMSSTTPFLVGTTVPTFLILAAADLSARLASTATGDGASLVAIEDAATNLAAATVEAALAEIFGTPSTTARRLLELATAAEIDTGTDALRAISIAEIIASARYGSDSGNFVTANPWVGFTTSPTTNFLYRRLGDLLFVKAQQSLVAISNATTCTLPAFSIPLAFRPLGETFITIPVQDNGVWSFGMIEFDNNGSVTLHAGPDVATAFTAAGNKGFQGNNSFFYRLG